MARFTVMLVFLVAIVFSASADNDGRYNPDLSNYEDDGTYRRPRDEGKYVHVPNPYRGGYGPYSGDWERYKHQGELEGSASNQKPVTVRPTTTRRPLIKYINNGNRIIRQDQALKENEYKYLYETENKILAAEKAYVKNPDTPDEGISSSGFYQYVGPDGVLYRVTYTADDNGFRPKITRVDYPESLNDGFTKLEKNQV